MPRDDTTDWVVVGGADKNATALPCLSVLSLESRYQAARAESLGELSFDRSTLDHRGIRALLSHKSEIALIASTEMQPLDLPLDPRTRR